MIGSRAKVRKIADALLEAGVRVFEWNGTMLHAKTAVADGVWARVGSTNLNRWAQRLAPVIRQLQRRPDVVVDLFIPDRRFPDFYDWYAREAKFYPLWVIPYRLPGFYPVSYTHLTLPTSDLV